MYKNARKKPIITIMGVINETIINDCNTWNYKQI